MEGLEPQWKCYNTCSTESNRWGEVSLGTSHLKGEILRLNIHVVSPSVHKEIDTARSCDGDDVFPILRVEILWLSR